MDKKNLNKVRLSKELALLERELSTLNAECDAILSLKARTVSAIAEDEMPTLSQNDRIAIQRFSEIQNLRQVASGAGLYLHRDQLKRAAENINEVRARVTFLAKNFPSTGSHESQKTLFQL
jgi:hypothetical protein